MLTHNLLLLILACLFGVLLLLSVGANELANVMSTTMGSKAATIRQAILIVIIFEVLGAIFGGTDVAKTIQCGIINTQAIDNTFGLLTYGTLAILLASAVWLATASFLGLPVSITNTIVGSTVGFGILSLGIQAVQWHKVWYIILSWILCPTIAGITAHVIFLSVQQFILTTADPPAKAHKYIPIYLFLVGFVLAQITVIKVVEHLGIPIDLRRDILLAIITGIVIVIIGRFIFRRVKCEDKFDRRAQFAYVEKLFGILMLFTACAMVYAHGSNDVAVAVGPIATLVSIIETGHAFHDGFLLFMVLSGGALIVIVGFLLYGKKIIETVGSGITALTPSRAYSATFAAAVTVVVSTSIGIPVSATQTLVGAILGVGLARGIGALDMRIVKGIVVTWIITIPITAALAVVFFNVISFIFR